MAGGEISFTILEKYVYMFRNQKIPLKRCEYFVQSVLRGMNWQESAEGEIHVTKPEKYMLSNQKNTAKKMEVLCTKCCAVHESA